MKKNLSESQQAKLKEITKVMSDEIMALLNKEIVPSDQVPAGFERWLKLSLPHETAKEMKTSYDDYKKFISALDSKSIEQFTIWEMGFAINCVESKSMVQLNCHTRSEYLGIQDAIVEMGKLWTTHRETLVKPISDKYNELAKRVKDGKTILLPKSIIS